MFAMGVLIGVIVGGNLGVLIMACFKMGANK